MNFTTHKMLNSLSLLISLLQCCHPVYSQYNIPYQVSSYQVPNQYQTVYGTTPMTASALLLSNEAYLTGQVLIRGYVHFSQSNPGSPVSVTGYINNLQPGLHGFHVNELGRLDNACTSTGGHFNPYNCQHGGPSSPQRHVGDLGNILANQTGRADISITDSQISLSGSNSIIGRSVVVNSGQDDFGLGTTMDSLTNGGAGSRLACGVIGLN